MIQELIKKEKFESIDLKRYCLGQLYTRPKDPYLHYLLGRYYQAVSAWDNAIFHYRMAILIRCDQLGTWQGLHNSYLSKLGDAKGIEKYSDFINNEISLPEEVSDIENVILIRITESQYVDGFVKDGMGRFNPTKNYRRPKEEGPWFDPDENRPNKVVDAKDIKLPGVHFESIEFTIGGLYRILCFSSVSKYNARNFLEMYDLDKFQDDANKEYSAIVVHNPKGLIKQIIEKDSSITFGHVKYLPTGAVQRSKAIYSPYVKDEEYTPEFEFRFSTQQGGAGKLPEEAIFIDFGDIEEFVTVMPPEELFDYISSRYAK